MSSLKNAGALFGRLLLGLIFVLSGVFKFSHLMQTAAVMAKAGIPGPMVHPLLYLAAPTELLVGLALVSGFRTRIAALVLFLFLIPVTLVFHHTPDQQINFMKNLAIMGGLLIVASQGGGGLSVDAAMRGRAE